MRTTTMGSTNNRREYLGSPTFNWEVPALSAGQLSAKDFAQNAVASQKYAPFNFITVTNNSEHALELWVNGNETGAKRIPANAVRTFDKKSIPALNIAVIKNVGSGATSGSGDVIVEVQKEVVDQETIISKVANKLFSGAGV